MFGRAPRIFTPPASRLHRLAWAVAVIGVAAILRTAIDPLVGAVAPFGLFVPAVVVAAWLGGTEAGVFATALAALVGKLLFVEPRYRLAFTPRDVAVMLMAVGVGSGLILLVTTWRRTQLRLQDLHDEMRGILEQLPTGVALADPSGRVVFSNAELERIIGGPAHLGDFADFRRTYTPRRADGSIVQVSESPLLRAAAGEEVPPLEAVIVRSDGSRRIVRVRGTPVRRHDGSVVGGAVTVMDVTELREADRAARDRAEELAAILDAVPVPVFVAGAADAKRVDGNRVAAELFRLPAGANLAAADLAGNVRLLKDGREVPIEELPLRQAMNLGEEVRGAELQVAYGDGGQVELRGNAVPLRAADGSVRGSVGAFMDVTESNRMERRLREQADELERANRVKDEFLATLGHELRTPLAAIVGWAGMLLRGGLSVEAVQKAHEAIARNADAQRALIEDVLDVSRIVSGKLRLEMGQADIEAPLRSALEAVKPQADAKDISVETTLADEPTTVRGDSVRLQQAFSNLLSNAVKFTDRGGRIAVSTRRGVGGNVEVQVSDSGIGIGPNALPHIFERFRQADSSNTRRYSGLGLGLAIVKHLVELHGGTIDAESSGEGRGATFTVSLPYHPIQERRRVQRGPARRDVPPIAPVPATPRSLCGVRVLVVDDEADTRDLTASVLGASGAKVFAEPSARDALARLASETPDVMLVDISMPDMDGYAFVQAVRENREGRAQVPAIAFTAYARDEDRRLALASGFQLHLTKPVEPDALVRAVASVLAA